MCLRGNENPQITSICFFPIFAKCQLWVCSAMFFSYEVISHRVSVAFSRRNVSRRLFASYFCPFISVHIARFWGVNILCVTILSASVLTLSPQNVHRHITFVARFQRLITLRFESSKMSSFPCRPYHKPRYISAKS